MLKVRHMYLVYGPGKVWEFLQHGRKIILPDRDRRLITSCGYLKTIGPFWKIGPRWFIRVQRRPEYAGYEIWPMGALNLVLWPLKRIKDRALFTFYDAISKLNMSVVWFPECQPTTLSGCFKYLWFTKAGREEARKFKELLELKDEWHSGITMTYQPQE